MAFDQLSVDDRMRTLKTLLYERAVSPDVRNDLQELTAQLLQQENRSYLLEQRIKTKQEAADEFAAYCRSYDPDRHSVQEEPFGGAHQL